MERALLRVVPPGGGEIIGDKPDRRVEILADGDDLHATWTRFGPGRDGADLHVHHRHTDLFFVLAGELTVRLGREEERAVAAGTLVRVPPLVVHGFRNAADSELRYLNLHAPGEGFADYMRGLRDKRPVAFDQEEPPAGGSPPGLAAVIGGVEERDGVLVHAEVDAITVVERRGGAVDGPAYVWVLDGEVTLDGGDAAQAGSWIELPPGAAVDAGAGARVLEVRVP